MSDANHQELQNRIAFLESKLDQRETELSYLNNLLTEFGFEGGIDSLKDSLEELLSIQRSIFPEGVEDQGRSDVA